MSTDNNNTPPHRTCDSSRLFQLDGWRGVSIISVLAAHWFPLGPSYLKLNETAGLLGMSLFFTLSGFLICSFLIDRPQPVPFLIRRCFRILPLAWVFMLVTLMAHYRPPQEWLANFLFYLNYTFYLQQFNSHLWSLCVEMHFYLFVAVLASFGGRRSLLLLPFLCIAITTARIVTGTFVSIQTHLRVDEILVGASLALAYKSHEKFASWLRHVTPEIAVVMLLVSCSPFAGGIQYLRPYAGGLAVGATIISPDHWVSLALRSRVLSYLASISYALYVIHGPFRSGWFAGAGAVDRYLLKRPLGVLVTFVLAHISTFHFEAYWIKIGKRLTANSPRDA